MSSLDYVIQDAWEQLLALPVKFWLAGPVGAFFFAVFACLFWSLHPMVSNKKLWFKFFPILWVAFIILSVAIETNNGFITFIGVIIFGIYAILVYIHDEIPPR